MLLTLTLLVASPQAIVRDIRPTPAVPSASVVRGASVAVGNLVCMVLDDLQHGTEPWVSDGTPGGTRLLCDVQPGRASSNPGGLSVAAGRFFFWADRVGSGRELWASDGTPVGTRLVIDMVPGSLGTDGAGVFDIGGVGYFMGQGGLWRTDATTTGTVLVHSLPPYHYRPVVAGGRLFFAGGPASNDLELWMSDTTSALLVRDINPLGGSLDATRPFAVRGAEVFFHAFEPTGGAELWRSDGTAAGTQLVRDIRVGALSSGPQWLTSSAGLLFFTADDGVSGREVWATDGSAAGTQMLGDLVPGIGTASPRELVALQNGIAFAATVPASGAEIWLGTASGVQLIADIVPGPGSSSPLSLLRLGNRALFGAIDGANDAELWATDGTAAGTARVADVHPTSSSQARPFVAASTFALFDANDGVRGREILRSDGTTAGTQHLGNLATTPGESSSPAALDRVDQAMVLGATIGTHGTSVWAGQQDGSNAVQLADVPPAFGGLTRLPATRFRGRLFFPSRLPATGEEPWVTDGTPAGTSLFVELTPGSSGTIVGMAATRRFLVIGTDAQLYVSDGSTAGTRALATPGLRPMNRFVANDTLVFFVGREQATLFEVWRSDGTDAGTYLLRDIHQGVSFSIPSELVVVGERLFFVQLSSTTGSEVWTSDGTTAGTQLLEVRPGSASASPQALCAGGGRCFFQANDGVRGVELWSSDGTPAGTTLAADLVPGPGSAVFWGLTGFAGGAFFFFDDGVHGFEPWVSDGTAAGTRMLGDLCPGPAGSLFEAAVACPGGDEHVAFVADDGAHGAEVWITDGTAAGTRRLTDLRAGAASMHPYPLAFGGSRLWFSASDDLGREPWSVDLRGEGVAIVETYGASCDGAGFVPRMRPGRPPRVGRPVDIVMEGGPGNAPGVLLFGAGPVRIPLDASGTCFLLVSGLAVTLPMATDGAGGAAVTVNVPLDPSLVGVILTEQFALAQIGGPIFGAAIASDGLWMLIGR